MSRLSERRCCVWLCSGPFAFCTHAGLETSYSSSQPRNCSSASPQQAWSRANSAWQGTFITRAHVSWTELGVAIYWALAYLLTDVSLIFKTLPSDWRHLKLGSETMNSFKNRESKQLFSWRPLNCSRVFPKQVGICFGLTVSQCTIVLWIFCFVLFLVFWLHYAFDWMVNTSL